jgi:Zn-dependent protease with chaperone function
MARFILIAFLLLAVTGQTSAQIRQSRDSLFGRRERAIMARFHDFLKFPEFNLPTGKANIGVTIEGPNVSILAVGPSNGHEKEYAQRIEDWNVKSGFTGKTYYSKEDEGAVATIEIKTGGFGKMESHLVVPIDDLVQTLGSLEPQTNIALVAPAWTNLDTDVKPDYVNKSGMRFWNISTPGKIRSVASTLSIPTWVVPALVAWVFLPIVGMGTCFAIGMTVARDQRRPIEQRRKIYSTFVLKGTYIVLGLHTLLVVATLPTRALDPVSQLWFGFRFSQIGLFVVPLFMFVPIVLLPWLTKTEKKLLGATPEEAAKREDFSKYTVPNADLLKTKSTFSGLIPMLGLVLLMVVKNMKSTPIVLVVELVGLFAVLAYMVFRIVGIFSKKGKPVETIPEFLPYLARVQQRIQPISRRLELACPPLSITPLLQGPYGAAVTKKSLMVSPALADRFGDEELDFVLAHELAHLKVNHLSIRRVLILGPVILVWFLFTSMIIGRSITIYASPAFTFSPFLLILVVSPLYRMFVSRLYQKQEYDADEIAVRTTRHKDGAIRALIKMAEQNSLPGFEEVAFNRTHPKIGDRIARIRSLQNV